MSENHLRILLRVLVGICSGFAAADLFYTKHVEFGFQSWIAFDAVFGFVACVGLVLIAKQLRRFLMRDEDYYDR